MRWINVGQDFQVRCDIQDPDAAAIDAADYTGHLIYYKRPDGVHGSITPTSATGIYVTGLITLALNPLAGLAGVWEFYVLMTSGSQTYRSKKTQLLVHPMGF